MAKSNTTSVLAFDGTGDFIDCGNPAELGLADSITIEAWIYPLENDKWSMIANKWDNKGYFLGIRPDGGGLRWTLDNEVGHCTSEPIEFNQWIHVAGTYDGKTLKLYQNGTEAAQRKFSEKITQTNVNFQISKQSNASDWGFFAGRLAEIRVWNYPRTEAEIKAAMSHRLVGDESGLVGYWPLNEGSGKTVHDKSPNANHGKITGASWRKSSDLNLTPPPAKPEETEADMKRGPAGSDIKGKAFEIQPRQDAPQSKISKLFVHAAWAIDALQAEYEDLGTQPPEAYSSTLAGKRGNSPKEWTIEPGDYLTEVSGSWGRQTPGHPKETIISIQFQTRNGVTSRIFGGDNPRKVVEPFTLTAPEGYAISGFFGATNGKNLLARLGVYLQSIEELTAEPSSSEQSTATQSTSTSAGKGSSKSEPEKTKGSASSKQSSNTSKTPAKQGSSSSKGKSSTSSASEVLGGYIPAVEPRTPPATGLEDYSYWVAEVAKEKAAKAGQKKKPFRRGRIWA